MAISVFLVVLLRLPYLSGLYYDPDVPYRAYIGWTLFEENTKGFFLYGIMPPGIDFLYRMALSAFGPSFVSIQILAIIFCFFSVLLLWLFSKHILSGVRLAFLLPVFFALFCVSEPLQGHTANIETFLNTFEIAALFFLGWAVLKKKNIYYAASGFFLGIGLILKQSALPYFVAGLVFIYSYSWISREHFSLRLRRALLFMSAFFIPLLVLLIYFSYLGIGAKFLVNKIALTMAYLNNIKAIRDVYLGWALEQIGGPLKGEIIIFGFLALFGLVSSLRRLREPARLLVICWFVIPASLILRGGFHFRHQYLEILAPLLAISVIGASDICAIVRSLLDKKRLLSIMAAALGICILSYPFFHRFEYLITKDKFNNFLLTNRYLSAASEGEKEKLFLRMSDEFADAATRFVTARYIKERTTANDKIFVWDELDGGAIYLWSGRHDPYTFTTKALFLPDEFNTPVTIALKRTCFPNRFKYYLKQKFLMQKLTAEPPLYIIIIPRYMLRPNAPFAPLVMLGKEKKIFPDLFSFIDKNYVLETQLYNYQLFRRLK